MRGRSNKEHTRKLKEVMDWPQKGPTEIFETFHSYKSSFNLVISINIITCFPFRPYSELQNLVPFHVFHMIPLMLIPDALGTHKSWTLPTWRERPRRPRCRWRSPSPRRPWRPRRHRTARRVCSRSTAPASRAFHAAVAQNRRLLGDRPTGTGTAGRGRRFEMLWGWIKLP